MESPPTHPRGPSTEYDPFWKRRRRDREAGGSLRRIAAVLFAVVFLPPLAAYAAWWLTPPRPLDLVLLDKTVPDRTFREHAGLVWILQNGRWVRPGGRPYRLAEGYFGFHPLGEGRFEVRTLPDTLADADLIYVTDTYGVTAGALSGGEGEDASRLLYGGLRTDEVEALRTAVGGGVPLVAEFNTLGSPSGEEARSRMEGLLGVEWSGWAGRWIGELANPGGLPPGAVEAEEARTGEAWSHRGPGLILTHLDGRTVVLPLGSHLDVPGPTIHPDSRARARGVREGVRFQQWFGVVSPGAGSRVLAEFRLAPTPEGRRRLEAAGLPVRFPAVVRSEGAGAPVHYFAGDFADRGTVPGWHRFRLVPALFRVLPMPPDDPMVFFWKAYLPLVRAVLAEAEG